MSKTSLVKSTIALPVHNCNLTTTCALTKAPTPPQISCPTATVDTGASSIFVTKTDAGVLVNADANASPVRVRQADGSIIQSSASGLVDIPILPTSSRTAHVLPNLHQNLFGVGPLVDAGLTVLFNRNEAVAYQPVLSGPRDPTTKLWSWPLMGNPANASAPLIDTRYIDSSWLAHESALAALQPVHPPSALNESLSAPHVAFASIHEPKTKPQLAAYWSRCLGNPTDSTLISALSRGHRDLASFPGLTASLVRAHPPNSIESAQGHLDMQRMHVRSSQPALSPAPSTPLEETDDDRHPSPRPISASRNVFTKCMQSSDPLSDPTHRLHMDASGAFPVISGHGNKICLLGYDEDTNSIHVEPMKNYTSSEYVRATSAIVAHFAKAGQTLHIIRMDNQTSDELVAFVRDNAKATIEYVPPHDHRTNKAERAMRTFKNHFEAVLAGVDPSFPIFLWDELLTLTLMTLNMLRSSATIAGISAYEHVHGNYDYMRNPICPAGSLVLVFDHPDVRGSWAMHGSKGFYVGPAMQHYRCHRVFMPATNHMRTSNTISWHVRPLARDVDDSAPDFPPGLYLIPPASLPPATPEQRVGTTLPEQRVDATRPEPRMRTTPPEQRVVETTAPFVEDVPYGVIVPRRSSRLATAALASVQPTTSRPRQRRPRRPSRQSDHLSADERACLAEAIFTANEERKTIASASITSPAADVESRGCAKDFLCALAAGDVDASGQALKYRTLKNHPTEGPHWQKAAHTEFVKLFTQREAMHCILKANIPSGRMITYYNPQCKVKNGDRRVRGTVGGDNSDFEGATAAFTADLTTAKVLINHAVSDGCDFSTADIADFYLYSDLDHPEYMFIMRSDIPQETWDLYNMDSFCPVGQDRIYVEITKGIYGLRQSGNLAQKALIQHLAKNGYHETRTSMLFNHVTDDINFTLVVDDFAIASKDGAADRLYKVLREVYTLKVDEKGSKYCGMSITFAPDRLSVEVCCKGYVAHALKLLNVVHTRTEHSPERFIPAKYGTKDSQRPPSDKSQRLSPPEVKRLQVIVGIFLWYARTVDGTMLGAINRIGSRQAKPTQQVMDAADHFLQYAATYPDATLCYKKSDMIVRVDADGSYHSEEGARSRAAVFAYLGTSDPTFHNHPIELMSSIIPTVVASTSECEYASSFMGGQLCYPIRTLLEDLGWPQPPTMLTTDNKTAHGIASRTTKIKRSKAIDMRYHWIRDRVDQGDYIVSWRAGKHSVADFLTKAHPASHCKTVRHLYVIPSLPVRPTVRTPTL